MTYSCVTPAVAGEGNTDRPPEFWDPGMPYTERYDNQNHGTSHFQWRIVLGNYRLRPGSPCINTGTNQATWMPGAVDADGNPRIIGDIVDMGAYEFTNDALVCSFTADFVEAFSPTQVVLTAHADGANLTGLTYTWDFDDGSPLVSGGDKRVVTNTYTAGEYSPSLTVVNAAAETALCTRTNYLKFGPRNLYVAPSNSPAFPYQTWPTASTNIPIAVAAAVGGSTVWVADGTYTHPDPHILIDKAITVRSLNGHAVTIVDGQNARRNFFLDHPDCKVDGFTITRGLGNQLPVRMGAGAYIWSGGAIHNSWIHRNSSGAYHSGGIYNHFGGDIRNCILSENQGAAKGGIQNNHGVRMHNCLVTRNTSGYPNVSDAGGIHAGAGSEIVNCIVIANTNSAAGGAGMPDIFLAHTVHPSHTFFHHNICTHPANTWAGYGINNITNQEPIFVDFAGGDYRLMFESPGVDAGSNLTWAVEAGALDLAGNPRFVRHAVDMGPYEVPPRGMVLFIR